MEVDVSRMRALLAQARSIAGELGMTGIASELARLEAEARPASLVPSQVVFTLAKEGDVWVVSSGGATFRLKDSRGLQILSRLIAEPGREFLATDLAAPSGAQDTGDAGEAIDVRARDAYRRRVADLQAELREAESFGDPLRAERAREEIEFLTLELSRTIGLGGQPRKAASAIERARSAVSRRIRDAIRRIARHDPALGEHLEWAVRTGTYCSYRKS
jgi:hypothetical protein